MKFCDKLSKLRKQNNITQEQLADRLNMSRQAVSKWELGVSIPDMDKMIQLCNILNCTLEDLLDDGVVGNLNPGKEKNSFANYFQDFLKYITNLYNMFCSMKFKQKFKFLFEMAVISILLLILGAIINVTFEVIFLDFLNAIPFVGSFLTFILRNLFTIFLIIVGIIIFFHLLKIRYLDYYITIEDKNITEKTIESPIDVLKLPNTNQEKVLKEKIIIRDPKHSTFSFFEFLSKIILITFKIFVFTLTIFVSLGFIFEIFSFFILIWHLKYSSIFFFLAISLLGIIFLTYITIEIFYNFIISKKQHFKRIFILIIISFLLLGFGISATTIKILNFQELKNPLPYFTSQTITLPMNDNLLIEDNYPKFHFVYNFDDSKKDLTFEFKTFKNISICKDEYIGILNNQRYDIIYFYEDLNFFNTYEVFKDLVQEEKYLNFDQQYEVVVTLSTKNYQKLQENYKEYF